LAAIEVGVRELKARLSAYVRKVKAGATIIITERGKPVGRIAALQSSPAARIADLAKSGQLCWNGKKFFPRAARIRMRRNRKMSDIVMENRA